MTPRFYALAFILAFTTASALSLGGRVFYFLSILTLLLMLYALASVLLCRRLLVISLQPDDLKAERGTESSLRITSLNRSPLPVAAAELELILPDGRATVSAGTQLFRQDGVQVRYTLPHVGVVHAHVAKVCVSDLFHLLRICRREKTVPQEILVLPRDFEVSALRFHARDDGQALLNRSSEDVTSPEDTRAYRVGDPLKRVHWKLSARKREMIVRRFEVPAPPDTLILMDCSDPVCEGDEPDGLARLRDTLCETAVSVAKAQMELQHPIRVPLYGARAGEFRADRTGSLSLLREELAYQIFRGGEPFDRVLHLELRRMRRTGATVILTTRLDAAIVEGVRHIRRMGSSVRFYLVTFKAEDPKYAPYISRLQHHLVEVCYVTPA